ncbi:MAG: ABC transporter permease [Candidatus Aminicenantes bacterium]|nr:ABC transporter permease [Candidatus Aminicenantes bacterium]
MMRRVLTLARKEALHIRRDPRSLFLAIGLPIILVLIFSYAINYDIRHAPIGVLDQDKSALSRELISRTRSNEYFDLRVLLDDYAQADDLLKTGAVRLVIVIPVDFAKNVDRGADSAVQLLVDGANNNTALITLGYVSGLMRKFIADIFAERLAGQGGLRSSGIPMVEPRTRVWYNPELKTTNFIVPGLLAVVMMVMTAMLTSLTVAREWENGTMEQLISSPVRGNEIIIGKLIPYFGLGMVQVMLIVLTGTLVFRVPLRGNLFSLFTVCAIFLLCGLGIGLLVSIVTKNQQLAYTVAILTTMLPAFLLSGFISPIASMPKIIQIVTYFVPARYFLTALRGIFLKGYGFGQIWTEIAILTAFAALVFIAAMRRLKLRLE